MIVKYIRVTVVMPAYFEFCLYNPFDNTLTIQKAQKHLHSFLESSPIMLMNSYLMTVSKAETLHMHKANL